MPRFKLLALRTMAVLMLMTACAMTAHAQAERQGRSRPAPRRAVTFDISGVYTGVYNGVISIDGIGYPISPSAHVYLLGAGAVPIGNVPIGNRIYAAGRGSLGTGLIETLIARPINDDASRSNSDAGIRLHDPNAPE